MIALKSERVVLPGGIQEAVILISGTTIQEVCTTLPPNFNGELIDAGSRLILPGLIDPHVHINEPGRTDWEGFKTATRAALWSGITTLIEMPLNAHPVTTTVDSLLLKLQAAEHQIATDMLFWGGVVPGNDKEIDALAKAGVPGFKAFLTHSGIDEFPNVTASDLDRVMPKLAALDLPLLVHCELTHLPVPPFRDADETRYSNYLNSRPKIWEEAAIELMIEKCRQHRCRVHIVHLSAATALPMIEAARREGLPITVETAQHYLWFQAESVPDAQPVYKCAPPIREASNNQQLWDALAQGSIDLVGTDHSPAPPELKHLNDGNLMKAWGGIAGLQFALPVMNTLIRRKGVSPEKLAEWMSAQPARLAGISNRKGAIKAGWDADFAILEDDLEFTVREEMILHRHKACPYTGQTFEGQIWQTWLRGRKVYCRQEGFSPASGTIIHPSIT